MNEFQGTAVVVALFALRCVLPLALLFAIGYAMTRLANRWEIQEKGQPAAGAAIPLPMAGTESPSRTEAVAAALKVPCWVYKNCDETKRARCPATRNPSLACWVALTWAEGRLPAKCANCPRYTGAPALAVGD